MSEPDREGDLPHPREVFDFFGHEAEEAALAEALGGRAHHAWLITGPKGLGKATLAYRMARRALGSEPAPGRPLACLADDPTARLITAQSHPDLFVLRRSLNDRGKLRSEIAVDDARALGQLFALKPAAGGWRVAIIDAADDLNRNAANALLKVLEEPPAHCLFLLIAHAPGRLLATIRSRCRRLRLRPLGEADMRRALDAAGLEPTPNLLRLAAGRPGAARVLAAEGAAELDARLGEALLHAPKDGGRALLAVASGQGGADAERRLPGFLDLATDWARRAALAGAGGRDSADVAALAAKAPPQAWAEAFSALETLREEAVTLPLDPAHAYVRAAAILAAPLQPQ